jgi:release factor glutamine methyltransferase
MTLKPIYKTIVTALNAIYETHEAQSIAFLLIEHLYKANRTAILVDKPITNFEETILQSYLSRLLQHEPIQYLVGKGHFYGYEFVVNPHTLIPRQETEELVHKIITQHQFQQAVNLIDIGTGTGCIAISLAKILRCQSVYAVDIDYKTLATAQENALHLQTKVNFLEANILTWQKTPLYDFDTYFDIVVSNPPYICENEKISMQHNVLDYEPAKALFVSNEKPLIFYENIADFATKALKKHGKLYFEINEQFGQATQDMLQKKGFVAVNIYQDLNNKDRIIEATKV